MSIHIEAAFVPIVLNLVANIQAANPDRDLSVLIACLEDCGCYSIERLESGRRDLWCPPSKKLYPCLNFVLDILADRVIAQPEAWKLLLPAAKILFHQYQRPALVQAQATGKPHATFKTYREFLRWMGPMDRIAAAVGGTKDSQRLAQARQQIAEFTTDVLQMVGYHQALRGTSDKVFYKKTRRESAAFWLRLEYSLLDERFGLKTYHHPLTVLRRAERSVPGAKGMLVQHGFALSLIFPTGPTEALPTPRLEQLVASIPIPQLQALRRVSEVWPDRASLCSHCAADLTNQPKRRACKACDRPAYCGPACQKADWMLKHREICSAWVVVNKRMLLPSVKRSLDKQAIQMGLKEAPSAAGMVSV